MSKSKLTKPTLIILYGLPGSGKSAMSRQLSELLNIAHVSSDRIRFELFDKPTYSGDEQDVVKRLMNMMTEQFLSAGISVIYDINAAKLQDRRNLRDMAKKFRAEHLLLWIQIDADSAFDRASNRDARKTDDKYTPAIDEETFIKLSKGMQNPYLNEVFTVISGKHLFGTQKHVILRKLKDMGLLSEDAMQPKIAKPELVNLVSRAAINAGRVDHHRRNISIGG